jgi:hypothetical protein
VKPWSAIQENEDYQALTEEQQYAVQDEYFNRALAPNIPEENLEETRSLFYERLRNSPEPPTAEAPSGPTALELAQGAGASLIKGAQMVPKLVPDIANMVGGMVSDDYPNSAAGRATHAASEFFEKGIEAGDEVLQPESVKEAIQTNKIFDPDTGEWRLPNSSQVTDTVFSVVPMLPTFLVGGGGLTNLFARVMPSKAAAFTGYGTTNAAIGGADSFSEGTQEARKLLDSIELDLTTEEKNVVANVVAREATERQLPIAFAMGAIGLGGASQVPGKIAARAAKGAAIDAVPEVIEEGSQGMNINQSIIDHDLDPNRDLLDGVPDRAVLGAIGGGVVGGAIAAASGAPREVDIEGEFDIVDEADPAQEPELPVVEEIAPGLFVNVSDPSKPPFEGAIKKHEAAGVVAWVMPEPLVEENLVQAEQKPILQPSYDELAQPASTMAPQTEITFDPEEMSSYQELADSTEEAEGSDTEFELEPDDFTREIQSTARVEIDEAGAEAATSPLNDLPEPTAKQQEAGNYKKGHIKLNGFDITIENPKGSTRRGEDRDGNEWSVEMANDYGYIRKTRGADDPGSDVKTDIEHVDVFIGPNPSSESVFVVNQVIDGEFDEHKVMFGYDSQREAEQAYLNNYEDGWQGLDSTTEMDMATFREWVYDPEQTSKPAQQLGAETTEEVESVVEVNTELANTPVEPEPDNRSRIERFYETAQKVSSPVDLAQRATESPEGTFAELQAAEAEARQIEKDILARTGKKKFDELDESELSESENNFMFYSDLPTDAESFRRLRKVIEPVEDARDATTELRRAMLELPESTDPSSYSSNQEASVARLLFVSSEMERLGMNPEETVDAAIAEEVARHSDDLDGEFMARELRNTISNFINVRPEQKQPTQISKDSTPDPKKEPIQLALDKTYQRKLDTARDVVADAFEADVKMENRYSNLLMVKKLERFNEGSLIDLVADENLRSVDEPRLRKRLARHEAEIEKQNVRYTERVTKGRTKGAGAGGFNRDIERIREARDTARESANRLQSELDRRAREREYETGATIPTNDYGVFLDRAFQSNSVDGQFVFESKRYPHKEILDAGFVFSDLKAVPEDTMDVFEGANGQFIAIDLTHDGESWPVIVGQQNIESYAKSIEQPAIEENEAHTEQNKKRSTKTSEPNESPKTNQQPPTAEDTGKITAGPFSVSDYNQLMTAARDGSLTPDVLQQSFTRLLENQAEVKKRIAKETKAEIFSRFRLGWSLSKNDKKDRFVDAAYDAMLYGHLLNKPVPSQTISFGQLRNREKIEAERLEGIKKAVFSITEKDIAENKESLEQAEKARAERQEFVEKASENPETFDELQYFVDTKGEGELSPEQLEKWDQFKAERGIETRKRVQDQKQQDVVTRTQVELGEGISFTIEPGKHSKTGEDLFNVRTTEKVDKEDWKKLMSRARKMGGGYWRGNYWFPSEEMAQSFVDSYSGKEVEIPGASEKKGNSKLSNLLEMADKIESRAIEKRDQDRRTNTVRQASQAASAVADAESNIAFARTLRNIAVGIEDGSIRYLANLTSKVQLENLEAIRRQLKYSIPNAQLDEFTTKDGNSRRSWKPDVTLNQKLQFLRDDALKIVVRVDGLESLARDLQDVSGYKQAASGIRSRIKGKNSDANIVLGVSWSKIVDKVKTYAKRPGIYGTTALSISEKAAKINRLANMGITNLNELRAALRELETVRETPAAEDPIKSKERELIGLKFDGYFPTPRPVIDRIFEEANIETGHTILEPSAGKGSIVDAIVEEYPDTKVTAIEWVHTLREILELKGHNVVGNDIFQHEGQYDRVLMNPPFEDQVAHVRHAFNLVKPEGRLVSVMSAGVNNTLKNNREFVDWVESLGGTIETLPDGSFINSDRSTGVSTVLVTIDKPASTARANRKRQGNASLTVQQIERAIAPLVLNQSNNRASYVVIDRESDLPQHVLEEIGEAPVGAQGLSAYYDITTDTVFLNRENISSTAQAIREAVHETYGHRGPELYLGEDYVDFLDQVDWLYRSGDPEILKLAASVRESHGEVDPATRAAEIIARMAESESLSNKGPRVLKDLWTNLVNSMRKFLKSIGFDIPFSVSDIRYMLMKSRKSTVHGHGSRKVPATYPASRASRRDHSKIVENESVVDDDPEASRFYRGMASLRRYWLAAVGRNDLADIGRNELPQLKEYVNLAQQMDAYTNELMLEPGDLDGDWRGYNNKHPNEREELSRLMHDSTIAGVDPSQDYQVLMTREDGEKKIRIIRQQIKTVNAEGSRVKAYMDEISEIQRMMDSEVSRAASYPGLRKRYEALSSDGQGLFESVRDQYIKRWDTLFQIVEENVNALIGERKTRAARIAQLRQQFEFLKLQGPYFPLARFGDYWVYARKGTDVSFDMFEKLDEQRNFRKQMEQSGYDVDHGRTLDDFNFEEKVPASFMSEVIDLVEKGGDSDRMNFLKDGIYQLYLDSLPSLSIRKQAKHRKKTKGYSNDAMRAFATQMLHGARQISRLKYSGLMDTKINEIQQALFDSGNIDALENEIYELNEALKMVKHSDLRGQYSQVSDQLRVSDNDPSLKQLQDIIGLALKARDDLKFYEDAYAKLIERRLSAMRIGKDKNKSWDLLGEIKKSYEWQMNPKGGSLANSITSFTFLNFLGFNVSSAIVNVTQTPLIAYPVMGAKYGYTDSGKELLAASNDLMRGMGSIRNVLKDDELSAYDSWLDWGVIDRTNAHMLAGVAEEGAEYSPLFRSAMEKAAYLFHKAEVWNREVTALAAYRLEKKKSGDINKALSNARDMVWKTHYDYSSGNRARVMRGDVAKVLFIFKQYSINTSYLLISEFNKTFNNENKAERAESRKALTGILSMHIMAGGILALPLVSSISALVNLAFDDEDDPYDFETWWRTGIVDFFEPLVGSESARTLSLAIARGPVDALLGASVSSRIALDNLWMRGSDRALEGKEALMYYVEQWLGAGFGVLMNYGRAYDTFEWGDEEKMLRSLEVAFPSSVGNPMKAWRLANNGAENRSGDLLVEEFSAIEIAGQAFGWTPSRLANRYAENSKRKAREQRIVKRRSELLAKYYSAWRRQDEDDSYAVMEQIVKFNQANPGYPIEGETIRKSIRRRQTYRQSAKDGIQLNKKLQGSILEDVDFAN